MSHSNNSEREALFSRLQFLGQMGSTETALFHQKVAESFGMGITDMKTISTLMQEGPMTAGHIAQRLSLTTGAVTNVLDRLEKRGIVYRTADPADRRKVIAKVNLQAIEHDRGHDVYDSMGAAYRGLLNNYSTEELRFLVAYHEKQIAMTKQEIAKLTKNSA